MGSFKPKNMIDVIIGSLFFIVLCPFYFNIEKFVAGGMSTVTSPVDFPKFIIGIVVILSLLLMVTGYFKKSILLEEELEKKINTRAMILYLGVLIFYLVSLNYAGFKLSTPVVMALSYTLFKGKQYLTFIPFAIAFTFAIDYVAFNFMNIMLPAGLLFE